MVNEHLDLISNEHLNDVLSKISDFSRETKDFAFGIWNFICEQYKHSPSSISISQHCDGIISFKCDHALFFNSHHISCDEELLHIVSIIAEKSNLKGKMYLYSPEGLINQIDLLF